MIYDKSHTSQISFPLGGIGAGCIGLAGNGSLVDWEIYNAPNKHSSQGLSHFAIRAEKDGRVVACRILKGDTPPPYSGSGDAVPYRGFGFGPDSDSLCGLPHFREHTFIGEFPMARIDFGGEDFPATVSLGAWSVLIPGDDKNSSLPAAFFDIDWTNAAAEPLDFTVICAIGNPWTGAEVLNSRQEDGAMWLRRGGDPTDFDYGELAFSCLEPLERQSWQEYFYRGGWRDRLESYWNDLQQAGPFRNRHYDGPSNGNDTALLAAHVSLAPGQSHRTSFVLTWHVPNRRNTWDAAADANAAAEGLQNRWRNYYATLWQDALDSNHYARTHYDTLCAQTRRFRDALFQPSLPPEVTDAVSATLSVLKSPTCLRLEDGTFYGWEGVNAHSGSCEGSCAHVWGYQQALPFLFPQLERSMHEAHWRHSVDENGGSHFRLKLPLGIHAKPDWFRPCVDGQMGDIMKAFRDWRISGDTKWLNT